MMIEGNEGEGQMEAPAQNEAPALIEAPAPEASPEAPAPKKAKRQGAKASKAARAAKGAKPSKAEGDMIARAKAGAKAARDRAEAEKAAAPADPRLAQDKQAGNPYHFSGLPHNLPSKAEIESGNWECAKRLGGSAKAAYLAAFEGQMPRGPSHWPKAGGAPGEMIENADGCPIDFQKPTHAGYGGKWKALRALIDAGDLAALRGWNGGFGIRMNSSSSIPLGRFHQQAMIALAAQAAKAEAAEADKAARKAAREARKAAKAEGEGASA